LGTLPLLQGSAREANIDTDSQTMKLMRYHVSVSKEAEEQKVRVVTKHLVRAVAFETQAKCV